MRTLYHRTHGRSKGYRRTVNKDSEKAAIMANDCMCSADQERVRTEVNDSPWQIEAKDGKNNTTSRKVSAENEEKI